MPNTVLVRFARKPCDIHEVKASLRGADGRTYECAVQETVTLTPAEYDSFSMLLY